MRTLSHRLLILIALLGLSREILAQESPHNAISAQQPPSPNMETLLELNRQMSVRMKLFEEQMKAMDLKLKSVQEAQAASAPEPSGPGDPFAWGDFTWLNGGTRQHSRVIDTKYFTPQIDVDVNYTYSFNRPIDDTVVGSTALARNNELEIAFMGMGGDLHIGNVRGRIMLQYGTRSTVVPRNDVTITKGQFDLATAYRYISEAYAGYHFNKLHGINIDVGIFMSYIGLYSYDNFENWSYQPSFTSDNTPWFFNGARLQIFPTDRLKVEIWLINGWQSYGKFNELPGVGASVLWSPRESIKFVSNNYVGTDTQDHPGRVRFHTDNSFLYRYYNKPNSRGLSRAAFSATFDLGFEQGDGVVAFHGTTGSNSVAAPAPCTNAKPCEQDFVSFMVYNRLWFFKNMFGWTAGGGYMHNPGRYLVLVPTGVAATTFSSNPGTSFNGWDVSTNLDWMPTENITFRFEFVHREADVPYFAGRGGVTGPDGYKSGGLYHPDTNIMTNAPAGWTPDLVQSENRLIFALLFRL